MLLKTDNEPALVDLRNGIIKRLDQDVVIEKPPKGESQSNGAIENGVKAVKGMVRTYRLALERRLDGVLPTFHPIMAWLIEHAGENITKYLIGKDGKTGYERLFGKPARDEAVEFGENVWLRRRKGTMKDLETRWLDGIWLGKPWGAIDHLVYRDGRIHEARAVQRKPITERWSRGEVEKVNVWPWDRHKKTAEGDRSQETVITIPPKTAEEKAQEPPRVTRDPQQATPKSVYIQPEDLDRFSYTKGCRRCTLMRERKSAHGIRHTEHCRQRIMECLREVGDPRMARQEERDQEFLAEQVQNAQVEAAALGEGGASSSGSQVSPAGAASDAPTITNETREANENDRAGEVHAEDENMDTEDIMYVQRQILMTYLRKDKQVEVPEKKAKEIVEIYSLLLKNGIAEHQAKAKIWEFYSPPRITAQARSMPHLNLNGDRSFDLKADKDGKAWDFTKAADRARARREVAASKPYMVVGSPPCTDWCALNLNCNHPKMRPEERERRITVAKVHLRFCAEIYRMQLRGGRHFLHEHPSTAKSWQEPEIMRLRNDPKVSEVIGHMCELGMAMKGPDGVSRPVRKSTRWLSSAREVLRRLDKKCTGHVHTKLEGGRPAAAAVYPPELCKQILEGINAQWEREGHEVPGGDRGIFCIEEVKFEEEWHNVQGGAKFWDSVTGDKLPEKETIEAREDEVKCMDKWDIWDIVDIEECRKRTGKSPISGRWVDHNKGDAVKPNVRSRYVAQEIARWKDAGLFAATPPLEALRILLTRLAKNRRRKLLLIDVRKAYLHAEVDREIYVQLPKEMGLAGKCGRLKKCLYGTRDAAVQWEALYSRRLEEMGFRRGKASPCCFYHESLDVRCVVHGDDFTFEGEDRSLDVIQQGMTTAFECKVEGRLGGGVKDKREVRILNRVMTWSENEVTWEADPRHAEALIRDMEVSDQASVVTPGVKQNRKEDEEEEETLGEDETALFRSGAAKANYLAMDRPDIAYAAKECCRHMSAPTKRDLESLRRLAKYLKGEPRRVYRFPRATKVAENGIRVYTDSDFAGCPITRKSTAGGLIMVGGYLVKHWSSTLKTIALSSGEAELAAIVKGASEAIGTRSLCQDMGIDAGIDIHADSAAAIGICQRMGVGRVRHLDVAQLWVQEKLKAKELSLHKCLGTENPADILTKYVTRQDIDKHMPTYGIVNMRGRPELAPKLI